MSMKPTWKIAELAEAVGQILAAARLVQPSGRVREMPDLRTIRYYTTLGLLDPPLEIQGRTAFYGLRHVWQLLAIKRLQCTGVPLVEIQQRLAGADDRTLKKLADVPERLVRSVCGARIKDKPPEAPPARSKSAFWAELATSRPGREPLQCVGEASPTASRALHVKLGEGVTLVLEGVDLEVIGSDKLAVIESAGRELIDKLHEMGLTQTSAAILRPSVERSQS